MPAPEEVSHEVGHAQNEARGCFKLARLYEIGLSDDDLRKIGKECVQSRCDSWELNKVPVCVCVRVCVCACVRVCVCVCACARACVGARGRARARACVCMCAWARGRVRVVCGCGPIGYFVGVVPCVSVEVDASVCDGANEEDVHRLHGTVAIVFKQKKREIRAWCGEVRVPLRHRQVRKVARRFVARPRVEHFLLWVPIILRSIHQFNCTSIEQCIEQC
jgi:hypothetical protein